MSSEDFYFWMNHALPGERYVYHRGLLCEDMDIKRDVWRQACLGNLYLVQRRIRDAISQFEYIAERASLRKNRALFPEDYVSEQKTTRPTAGGSKVGAMDGATKVGDSRDDMGRENRH